MWLQSVKNNTVAQVKMTAGKKIKEKRKKEERKKWHQGEAEEEVKEQMENLWNPIQCNHSSATLC